MLKMINPPVKFDFNCLSFKSIMCCPCSEKNKPWMVAILAMNFNVLCIAIAEKYL